MLSYYSLTPKWNSKISPQKKTKISNFKRQKTDYSKTLNLPETKFPMRANAQAREPGLDLSDFSYQWQLENNTEGEFVLHDGPPYANGPPHLGHSMNKILKDITVRYKAHRGFKTSYIPGWDCHGLPIELKALEILKEKGKKIGPLSIRTAAKKFAAQQIEIQKKGFRRYGIMGDWENPYKTMSKEYETHQIDVFYEMVKKGMIYRGVKPVYWSPSSKTALAESELEYNEAHESFSAYIGFPVKKTEFKGFEGIDNLHMLIWTTTPWTIPANLALCVSENEKYCLVEFNSKHYVIAEDLVENISALLETDLQVKSKFNGSDVVGTVCTHPIYPERESIVLHGPHVTTSSGTGVVHTAPGHGHEDYSICMKHNIEPYCPVDDDGKFISDVQLFAGLEVLGEGNKAVLEELQRSGMLVKQKKLIHSYPYDWRTKKPVIIRTTKQWFADLSTIKDDALSAMDNVRLIPDNGRARMVSMVSTRDNWCISRQRAWGFPIPVFYHKETGEVLVNDDTIAHIRSLIEKDGGDIWWKKSIAELLPEKYNADDYIKCTDTMDVWFDSGVSWNSVIKSKGLPTADVYLEGSDQYRGWFQSSLLTSIAVQGKAPYKNILTHGFTLDSKGKKMSKSIGNVISPDDIINGGIIDGQKVPAFGADVLRYWVGSMDYTTDVTISAEIINETSLILRKIRNTARYLLGNINEKQYSDVILKTDDSNDYFGLVYSDLFDIDKYFLNRIVEVSDKITNLYDNFSYAQVCSQIAFFTNELSSFYFDILKDRLYVSALDSRYRLSCQYVLIQVFFFFSVFSH
eukprot:TRINITY_DN2671_c0_g1_i2.p1 TRINITY_DN2671_c0_g1~~TRINITY_DN2671_c0_g1_i2.p1  ORF type:complete len:821 (+),score=168.68 TRINITY_DN2671_c0_g1_i2:60-2465(+)